MTRLKKKKGTQSTMWNILIRISTKKFVPVHSCAVTSNRNIIILDRKKSKNYIGVGNIKY